MDKYSYTYEWTPNYCYKNSDVLINKLNIKNNEDLSAFERNLVSLRTAELIDNPIKGNFDFNHLKKIHGYLFQDVYNWAGKTRNCSIAKKDLFCLPEYINEYAINIFKNLKKENYYILENYDKQIENLVILFGDINALHPFREGNGRTQREFIENLAGIMGISLDLTNITQLDMIVASHESINGNYEKLNQLFIKNASKLSKEEQIIKINKIVKSKILLCKLQDLVKYKN